MGNAVQGEERVVTLLDQDEVAEMLKVSPKTLEYWRYKKVGPKFIRVGKKLARYLVADVNEFIMASGGDSQ
jgi:DNA-binding XRE family transcriptional regulator